jgi:DNA modification methylase
MDEQIGLEATPEAYVDRMVEVFREVRRVLRDDGTLWLNLGDSYASGGRAYRAPDGKDSKGGRVTGTFRPTDPEGVKPKDLIGIPWRVAFALQADGWYLRQDMIWAKPNPMPESVTDRCTKAHEYLFLLSKNERYYFDAGAIKEPVSGGTHGGAWTEGGGKQAALGQQKGGRLGNEPDSGTRNRRSVWTVTTKPYKGAHFATFPPALIEPCILAGSKPGDVVLDPFGGAGTTALVAQRHGRRSVYIELNPEYVAIARARLAGG